MKPSNYHFFAVATVLVVMACQACVQSAAEEQARKASFVIQANDELFNKGNLEYADEIFAADYPGGPAAIKKFVAARRAAFPDLQVKIEQVVTEGDMVAWLRTNTGTQAGDYAGRSRSNKRLTWNEMIFSQFNNEGKIVKEWAVSDMQAKLDGASDIDGVYQYVAPLKGQGVNHNGRFLYLVGPADGSSPMAAHSGRQSVSGDTVKNIVEYSTDRKQIGTSYFWKITSISDDTTSYQIMDNDGKMTGTGKAVKIHH